jgi:hypothetical protein
VTVRSLRALRDLGGQYMRKIRWRFVHDGANLYAKSRRHHYAEHASTRQMRY